MLSNVSSRRKAVVPDDHRDRPGVRGNLGSDEAEDDWQFDSSRIVAAILEARDSLGAQTAASASASDR